MDGGEPGVARANGVAPNGLDRALVFELATARFVAQREDALLLGPPGTGKSHLAQAIGRAAIQQGYRVIYREAHAFLEELAEATLAETRKDYLTELTRVPLLIIDDPGATWAAPGQPHYSGPPPSRRIGSKVPRLGCGHEGVDTGAPKFDRLTTRCCGRLRSAARKSERPMTAAGRDSQRQSGGDDGNRRGRRAQGR